MGRKPSGNRTMTPAERQERRRQKKAQEMDAFLRTLVDLTWGEAFGDRSVPSTRIQTRLIERARAAMKESINDER